MSHTKHLDTKRHLTASGWPEEGSFIATPAFTSRRAQRHHSTAPPGTHTHASCPGKHTLQTTAGKLTFLPGQTLYRQIPAAQSQPKISKLGTWPSQGVPLHLSSSRNAGRRSPASETPSPKHELHPTCGVSRTRDVHHSKHTRFSEPGPHLDPQTFPRGGTQESSLLPICPRGPGRGTRCPGTGPG